MAKKTIVEFNSSIKKLAVNHSDISFIIRPHPSESERFYKDYFKDQPNVYIKYECSSLSWINGADMLIHYDCTKAIKAKINGKQVLSYTPCFDKNLVASLPVYISDFNFTDEREFLNKTSNILQNISYLKLGLDKVQHLEKFIDNVSRYASRKIVDRVLELCELSMCFSNELGH